MELFSYDYLLVYVMMVLIPSWILTIKLLSIPHELGRYITARSLGVKTRALSIGVGWEMFGVGQSPSVRWQVCWIPIGFFVRLLNDETENSYSRQSLWKRALITASGPITLFIFAFVGFWSYNIVNERVDVQTVAGEILPDSPAMKAGIEEGDRVLSVNNKQVKYFFELRQAIRRSGGQPVSLVIQRQDKQIELTLTPKEHFYKFLRRKVYRIGIQANTNKDYYISRKVSFLEAIPFAADNLNVTVWKSLHDVSSVINYFSQPVAVSGPVIISRTPGTMVRSSIYAFFIGPLSVMMTFWAVMLSLLFPFLMVWDVVSNRRKQ